MKRHRLFVATVTAVVAFGCGAVGQVLHVDEDFMPTPGFGFDLGGFEAVMPDGKVIVDGGRQRLFADGTVDSSYQPASTKRHRVFGSAFGALAVVYIPEGDEVILFDGAGVPIRPGAVVDGRVRRVLFQTDGKPILIGYFETVNGTARRYVARLNTDGTLDTTFDIGSGPAGTYAVENGWIQPDGKILLCGSFESFGGLDLQGIVRLNSDGSIDFGFDPGPAFPWEGAGGGIYRVKAVAADGLGRILRCEKGLLRRSDPDGANPVVLASFDPWEPQDIVPLADGRILVAGFFEGVDGVPRSSVAWLHEDGSVDLDTDIGLGRGRWVESLVIDAQDRIFPRLASDEHEVIRYLPDGRVDPDFQPDALGLDANVGGVAIDDEGRVVIGGFFTHVDGVPRSSLARLNADGTLDATFDPGPGVNARFSDDWNVRPRPVRSIALQSDGAVLVGGEFGSAGGLPRTGVARFLADGSMDATFDAQLNDGASVYSVAVQADGRILIGGDFTSVGGVDRARVARLMPDGSVDTSFQVTFGATGANAVVRSVRVMADGRIVIAGSFDAWNGTRRWSVARLMPDGTLDATFDPQGDTSGFDVQDADVDVDGRVALAAERSGDIYERTVIAVLGSDGRLIGEASPDPIQRVGAPLAVTFDGAGGVLASLQRTEPGTSRGQRCTVERVMPTGQWDRSVAWEARWGSVRRFARNASGQIAAGGSFSDVDGLPHFAVARFFMPETEPEPRMANISTRGWVESGKDVLIAGFVVTGTQPQRLMIRAVGPTLERDFGMTGAASVMALSLYRQGESEPILGDIGYKTPAVGTVDATSGIFSALADRFGAFQLNAAGGRFYPQDTGRIIDLDPGVYTALVRAGTPGVGLVEIYDINGVGADRHMVNLSTRGEVGAGDRALIGGIVIDRGTKTVLVRGVGPALAGAGVTDFLEDPHLQLIRTGDGTEVASNEDWEDNGQGSAVADAATRAGAFAFDPGSKDAAILVDLEPGAYTALVTGPDGTTGVALVEFYEVPEES